MRKARFLALMALCSCLISAALGQSISGEVHDKATHNPIPGATVITGKSKKATFSDLNGKFTIELTDGDESIEVSHTGYKAQRIAITPGTTSYQIELETASSLDQVVVVAYGTQKKVNLTGAIATVDVNKTFGSKPLNDPTRALQGIVPGLTIQYGNGGLTSDASVSIRGVGSINGAARPLILVDNVQTDDLSIINPQDIESISVLKDAASASIYGARAAFGVVLIKTKSGRKNQKASISYTNNFSWNKPTIMPDFADPEYELQAIHDAAVRAKLQPETFGMSLLKLRDGIVNWKNNYAGKNGLEMVKGEDWDILPDGRTYFYKVWDPKKEMLNKYTFSQLHNLNIAGGSEKITYYLSAGYSYDGGIMKMNPDALKKYNVTAGVNATVTDWLDVSAKTLYRNFEYEYPYEYQNYWYYFWRWGSYFPYGTYQGKYFRTNSAYMAAANKSKVVSNYQRIDLGATIKISKKLNIRTDYTIGRDNILRKEASGPVIAWDYWTAGALTLSDIAASQNALTYTNGRLKVNTLNSFATYQDKFGDHNLKVIAGINAEDNENINYYVSRKGLLDPSQPEFNTAAGDWSGGPSSSNVPRGWSQNGHGLKAFAGYFGRINYDYKEKYLLELNGRYDGSSLFPPQDRWAFFPSVSAGYRISQEEFMDFATPYLNDLKLRASYGELGNQDISSTGRSLYQTIMTGTQANWLNNSGIYAQSISQPSAIAKSLQWERVNTLDFGLDARILNNHIGITFDWFERNTKGMIQQVAVPASFGVAGPYINAGNFRARGYEVNIDVNYDIGKDISLYGTFGFSDYKTVFTKWENPSMSINSSLNYVGKTYGEIWGFETDRFFESAEDVTKSPYQKNLETGNFDFGPGDIKYKDLDGNDTISGGRMTLEDHGDLKVIGNTQPRYIYNARIGGSWKNFDIDIFIQGVGKRSWWGIGNTILPMYQSLDILYANQMDFWTPDNTDARYPSPYPNNQTGTIGGLLNGSNNFYPQSSYLLNLAYCRLKNVSIGYTMPASLLSRYKVQKLRFYVSGQNLAEISNVGAPIDPEITDGGLNYTGRTYPFNRQFSFGIQITY
ncbi:SusC/RagA family TonB-linked outer membrane protein [Longitalea luteola]|uniref:SusC/RagA family TonB-linked outer membrane protein n=1 Tax=Longitalea luteola TaxID=2812563 RepID=UPI001A96D4D0|nr:TonB-dependent receptor [Longitalea luteola]